MGSIIERKRKDGSRAYLAQIVIKRGGVILHRENKTFSARREAAGWVARREEELERDGPARGHGAPLLAEAIARYTSESLRPLGKTKAQVLRAISAAPLGAMRCDQIGSAEILAFARQLTEGGRQPQTVLNYLSHLASVFAIARPAWGVPLDRQAMQDALAVAKRLGVTSKSRGRDRRPSLQELEHLVWHFRRIRRRRPRTVPMADILLFALFSTRRQEEVTRLAWADLDREGRRVLVRDMKDPGEKLGNHQWVDLPPEAMAVIERQPQTGPLIFPYSTDAISAAFTRACKSLGIVDLRFHDLRHEGISRLFEMGWSIPHVAAVSGHRSWQSLKRYTHIRQRGDKYEGWRVLTAAGNPRP